MILNINQQSIKCLVLIGHFCSPKNLEEIVTRIKQKNSKLPTFFVSELSSKKTLQEFHQGITIPQFPAVLIASSYHQYSSAPWLNLDMQSTALQELSIRGTCFASDLDKALSLIVSAANECVCQNNVLFHHGCQCGYFKRGTP